MILRMHWEPDVMHWDPIAMDDFSMRTICLIVIKKHCTWNYSDQEALHMKPPETPDPWDVAIFVRFGFEDALPQISGLGCLLLQSTLSQS